MKRYLTKAIALILVLLTILPALSSCGTVDYEVLLKDTMIYINPYYLICEDEMDINAAINAESEEVFGEHYTARYFYLPARSAWYEKNHHATATMDAEEFFAEGKLLTFGKESFLVGSSDFTKPSASNGSHFYKQTLYSGYCTDSEGKTVLIYVTDDGQLRSVRYTAAYKQKIEPAAEIGIDEAMKKAVDVINDKMINEYGLDIDFSKYELVRAAKDTDYYSFMWGKIVNGYMIKLIYVNISFDGEAYDFMLSDNLLENLESNPLLTLGEKEIEKYVFPIIEEKFSDLTEKGYDIVFDHVYTPAYRAESGDLSVFYFRTVEKYMLYVQIEYRLVNKEKNIDYPKSASILIPIQE